MNDCMFNVRPVILSLKTGFCPIPGGLYIFLQPGDKSLHRLHCGRPDGRNQLHVPSRSQTDADDQVTIQPLALQNQRLF